MATTTRKPAITKKKLIRSISKDRKVTLRQARHIVQACLDKMIDFLSMGERLEFRDFGIFEVVERKQKVGRNPKKANEPIIIPAKTSVRFTPGKIMRQKIEKPCKQ